MVQIRLLGGVTAATDDGTPLDVGAAKQQAVLAALALSAGQPVVVSRLIDIVWDQQPPRTAAKTLQGYIADLRARLGAQLITRIGAAYRLEVPDDAIDVHRFRRHLATGSIEAALDQWTGTPLAGLDLPGLQPEVEGLLEQWLTAVETDLQHIVVTDPARAVATLTRLTAEHPGREEFWALLMTALYRSGRQSGALAAYHRAREFLVDELGVEPGPRLRATERLVLVIRAVADALGVIEGSGATLSDSIAAVLRAYPTVLVLDNCEHLIEEAASLTALITAHAAPSRVLATSRERLTVAGEQLLPIGPLDDDAASALFIERAHAVAPHVDLADSAPTITEICRRLHGVPLAIELAAARTSSMAPAELSARLDDRLKLLTGGRRDGADRHRTLRATVAWSYELITARQQQLFQRLSAFTGPFTWAAAESVAGFGELDAVDVDGLLAELVERSMVTAEPGGSGTRLSLLETLRHFAAEQLAAHGDPDELAARHVAWCRAEVADIHEMLTGTAEVRGVERLRELWPNLRTAVMWACDTGNLQIADALVRPIAVEANLRRRAEISRWAERILELVPATEEDQLAFWLMWAANRHVQAGDTQAYERLIKPYDLTDHPLIRYTHAYLYNASEAESEADYDAAYAARQWLRTRGEDHVADLVEVAGVGSQLIGLGRFDELDELATHMEQRYQDSGPPTYLYFALGLRGYAAQFQGRAADAGRYFAASSEFAVPAGTFLVNRTVKARTVFDAGETYRALTMLLEHVDDVLATDYVDVVRMVAVEFVYMVAELGQLRAAAHVLSYLDTIGSYGVLVQQTVLADAVRRIHDSTDVAEIHTKHPGALSDARHTLAFMREVLVELLDE